MGTGSNIKARRKALGISAEAIAEAAGVSPATIYRYENGDIAEVPPDKLGIIAKSLRTTSAFLEDKLIRDLRALDISVNMTAMGSATLTDNDSGAIIEYGPENWIELRERDDFRTVWMDITEAKEKPTPGQEGELEEVAALFNSLSESQKEQAKSYLRFLKASEEKK